MKCGHCGKSLYPGAEFCPYCGSGIDSGYHGVPDSKHARETVGQSSGSYRYKPEKKKDVHTSRPDTSYRYRPDKASATHVTGKQTSRPDKDSATHATGGKTSRPDTGYRPGKDSTAHHSHPGTASQSTAAKSHPASAGTTPPPAGKPKPAQTNSSGDAALGLLLLVVAAVLIWHFVGFGDKEKPASAKEPAATAGLGQYVQEDLTDTRPDETYGLQQETQPPVRYANEILLDDKDRGACKKMVGDIGVMYFFMDDPDSFWSQQEIDAYLAQVYEQMNLLAGEAHRQGVNLTFHQSWEHCSTTVEAASTNTGVLTSYIIQDTGRDISTINQSLAEQMGMPQAYPVFIFNENGRAFAYPGDTFEGCFLFRDAGALRHETCHVFGAVDLYYTREMKDLAEQYLPGSIMSNSENIRVDELNAYLIGWTDTLFYNAQSFLNAVSWMTQEDLDAALEGATQTGQGTIDYGNGTYYEGNLSCGFPHGYGTVYYYDGGIFRGQFEEGSQIGPGTYIWSNGTRYEGEMKDFYPHGYGTMTYNNGYIQTGNWNMGTFLG